MVRNDLPGDSPDILNAYVFNITNLAAVRQGARPIVNELGPYVFRKWRIKEVRPHACMQAPPAHLHPALPS
jgi:hypothetical protein